jgi:hypothetical protein
MLGYVAFTERGARDMKSLDFGRWALCIGAAAALLSGCGGSQPPIGSSGAMPQTRAITQSAMAHSMTPLTSNDLLYISGGATNKVYVFSYPDGKLVQTLTGLQNPNGECVDASGNVYITQSSGDIVEYAHGGSSAINTFYAAYANYGCAVDPTTGNLAAATGHAVTVWPNGQGSPITYTNPNAYVLERYLGYDNSGNLFIGGDNTSYGDLDLAELPNGGASIMHLTLNGRYGGNYLGGGQVQWDGTDVAVGSPALEAPWIARFQVSGSSATFVGFTKLKLPRRGFGTFSLDGGTLVLPFSTGPGGVKSFGYWNYPKGGKPTKVFKTLHFKRLFVAAAISHG